MAGTTNILARLDTIHGDLHANDADIYHIWSRLTTTSPYTLATVVPAGKTHGHVIGIVVTNRHTQSVVVDIWDGGTAPTNAMVSIGVPSRSSSIALGVDHPGYLHYSNVIAYADTAAANGVDVYLHGVYE